MSGTSLAAIALWSALVLTGLTAGVFASRWSDPDLRAPALGERLLLASAAAAVIAWCAHAGALAGSHSASPLLLAHVPVSVGAGFRLAVLWATLAGAALTFAAALLVSATLTQESSGVDRTRFAAVAVSVALVALGVSAWFIPGAGAAATVVPPFVQSASASLAPLFALLSIGGLALLVARAVARAGGAPMPRALLLATWTAATAAVALEQMARSRLGIGPRDAVVLGSASSGLILWLVASALLHPRVQSFLLRVPPAPASPATRPRARQATWIGHAGAICVAVSFALHAFASRSNVALRPGESVEVTDAFRRTWQLVNQGVSEFDAGGVDVTALAVEAKDPAGRTRLLAPEIREFHGRDGQHLEAPTSIRSEAGGVTQAMRVLLTETDSLDVARVRVTFLAVPILWPIGIALLGLSVILAFSTPTATAPRSTST